MQVGRAVVDREDRFGPKRLAVSTRCALGPAPEHRCQAREDDLDVLVLAHEGVGAGVERAQLAVLVGGTVSSRHGVPRSAASSRIRRITVAPSMPGSTPSTSTASGRLLGRDAQPFFAARRDEHRVPGALERAAQRLAEGRAVVDDQDGRASR